MAIGFARAEYVSRSKGGNACCKAAYNARSKIKDEQTGITYNFQSREDSVYHEMILPEHGDKKFLDPALMSNEVESKERKKNSQLYLECVLALPKEEDVSLEMKIEMAHEFVKRKGWVEGGLGVQMDIHQPHEGEMNWHAHLLVTTRRFTKDGKELGEKARDLQPDVRFSKVQKTPDIDNNVLWTNVQNDIFKSYGMDLRVDLPGEITQEHIGPVRMRNILNQVVDRNEVRRIANIESITVGSDLIDRVTKHSSVFSISDLRRAVGAHGRDVSEVDSLVREALADNRLVPLYDESGKFIDRYTTTDIRNEESKLIRLSEYVAGQGNVIREKFRQKFNQKQNSHVVEKTVLGAIREVSNDLSVEQVGALEHLLLSESGIRVLRGRAGTGKSHVLKKIPEIAEKFDINVVGVAPTHKAKQELARDGYRNVDTIKGMLFKLYNDKFHLPKNSILVVDEAGMVGNDDYMELQRVAAARSCNLIKAGDERQISSVGRGGMFEVFAEKYRSDVLTDIKRQRHNWGKAVARAFSNGEVHTGLRILHNQGRIVQDKDKVQSMETLLKDWDADENLLRDKIILAVANKDVNALNSGARQYLKARGVLSGQEIRVDGQNYMKGDRVLIKSTNKDLGLTNGDIGELKSVSENKIVVAVPIKNPKSGSKGDNVVIAKGATKEIEFNPSDYSGFRHGYATTIFKSQAASILSVFVYHDGFAGIRNSYVGLSRHIKDLKLYINSQATRSMQHLVKQLGADPDTASSLSYLTKEDIANRASKSQLEEIDKSFFASLADRAYKFGVRKFTELTDKHIPDWKYYDFKPETVASAKVEKVLDSEYLEQEISMKATHEFEQHVERITISEDATKIFATDRQGKNISSRSIVADNIGKSHLGTTYSDKVDSAEATGEVALSDKSPIDKNNSRQSNKQKFYAKADKTRGMIGDIAKAQGSALSSQDKLSKIVEQRERWDRDMETLKHEVRFKAELIARDILGNPNQKLSNNNTLRFGDNGKIAVRVSGERVGQWYDFSSSRGGDIFSLIQEHQNCDFKGATEYLKSQFGIGDSTGGKGSHLHLVENNRNTEMTAKYIAEQEKAAKETELKIARANRLYNRSKPVRESSIAHKYLSDVRNIDCDLSNDIKTAGIAHFTEDNTKDSKGRKYLPALISFARDKRGHITGGQQIALDKHNARKAEISLPKKSFGKIAGSFVDVGVINPKSTKNNETNDPNHHKSITIIAEGIETALSVKQALSVERASENLTIKVFSSLGISNIRNYKPEIGEKIIIAADNDGDKKTTMQTIENAISTISERGALVEIAKPPVAGDFNDILCREGDIKSNEKAIAASFVNSIQSHTTNNLTNYFESHGEKVEQKLGEQELSDLRFIRSYGLEEGKIVDAYRKGAFEGSVALETTRKELEFAKTKAKEFDPIVKDTQIEAQKLEQPDQKQRSLLTDKNHFVKSILGMDDKQSKESLAHMRDGILSQYIQQNISKYSKGKAQEPVEAVKLLEKEQAFLCSLGTDLKHSEYYSSSVGSPMASIRAAIQNRKANVMQELSKLTKFMQTDPSIVKSHEITNILNSSSDMKDAHSKLLNQYQSQFKQIMVGGIKATISGQKYEFDNKHWSSPVKFLDHLIKNKASEYAPNKSIQQAQTKLIDMHKNKSKEIGGPEL